MTTVHQETTALAGLAEKLQSLNQGPAVNSQTRSGAVNNKTRNQIEKLHHEYYYIVEDSLDDIFNEDLYIDSVDSAALEKAASEALRKALVELSISDENFINNLRDSVALSIKTYVDKYMSRSVAAPKNQADIRNTLIKSETDELFYERDAVKKQLAMAMKNPNVDVSQIKAIKKNLESITMRICDKNHGLVTEYARRFSSFASPEDRADFEAAGMVGLLNAIDSFEIGRSSFSSWAHKRIAKEIQHAVRGLDHPTISIGDFSKRKLILEARAALIRESRDANTEPSPQAIAAKADVPLKQVLRVLDPPKLTSLSTVVFSDDTSVVSIGDMIPDTGADTVTNVLSKLDRDTLQNNGLYFLDAKELLAIMRFYGLDQEPTQKLSEIGTMLGVPRETARRIQTRALAKLQHPLVLNAILKNYNKNTKKD